MFHHFFSFWREVTWGQNCEITHFQVTCLLSDYLGSIGMDTGLPREAFPRNQAFVDNSVFPSLGKQQPRFAQDQPKGYFQLKRIS